MSVRYVCDLCDNEAAIEVRVAVFTPRGTPARDLKKHLCDKHKTLVRDFELSLIPVSEHSNDPS